jgi:hypothetical protein
MTLVVCTNKPRVNTQILTPSSQDVIKAIASLNNENLTGAVLSLDDGILFIYGGNQGRVWVTFQGRSTNREKRFGTLMDDSYTLEDGEIDISVDGEVNPIPLHGTVTKEIATEVAIYFLEHRIIPADVVWAGNMS